VCVARSPEGRAVAAERAAAAAPLTSEEARQQAQAEKLTLLWWPRTGRATSACTSASPAGLSMACVCVWQEAADLYRNRSTHSTFELY
jgi:hypothetical protein